MPIEILCGSIDIVDMLESATSLQQIRQSWQQDVTDFLRRQSAYLLY
jgi:uncharacterized protein YbbC (DUF1343 family)